MDLLILLRPDLQTYLIYGPHSDVCDLVLEESKIFCESAGAESDVKQVFVTKNLASLERLELAFPPIYRSGKYPWHSSEFSYLITQFARWVCFKLVSH